MPSDSKLSVVTLAGSPTADSRSAALLRFVERRLAAQAAEVRHIALRELPALDLLHARAETPSLRGAIAAVARADLVVVATPIYKASFSGLLKSFLDLLPPDALRGKTVWPLATGGSVAHLLALEYALKPVLAALGARDGLDAVFVPDSAWRDDPVHGRVPGADIAERLHGVLATLGPAARVPVAEPC